MRDRALFVGNRDDVVDLPFGPGLPKIRDWTAQHFDFPGYILPFDPAEFADREALRARLGFRPDETVVFAAVGGSGVGHHLLRKVIAAIDHTRRLVPELRMIVVAGPRIDPASLPAARRASTSAASCPISTRTSRPVTSPSSRAASARAWS